MAEVGKKDGNRKPSSGTVTDVLIIGAGASGLMAGLWAARAGAGVVILEKNDRPGRKLAATGNGRCNFTNLASPADAYRGQHPEFAAPALEVFSARDTIRFFQELGIPSVNRKDWLYPRSGQAQSVVDVLLLELRHMGVKLKTKEEAKEIIPQKEGGFLVTTQGWSYSCKSLILAAGSCASSIPGSGWDGYKLAGDLGHLLIKPLPALTGLRALPSQAFQTWAGVRTEGEAGLIIEEEMIRKEQGELQLTEYGLSGIPIFMLSRYAIRALDEGKRVDVLLDFYPSASARQLQASLEGQVARAPYKNPKQLLMGFLPDRLIQVLVKSTKDPQNPAALARTIKAFPLRIQAGQDFAHAQVCSGGIDTSQINPCTMESRLVPGLYFCGEILDIDGTCGGYNLQWAWSSAFLAGTHAQQARGAP